jgi:hypothetical protein
MPAATNVILDGAGMILSVLNCIGKMLTFWAVYVALATISVHKTAGARARNCHRKVQSAMS